MNTIKSSSTKTASKKWHTKVNKNYVGIVAVVGAVALVLAGVSVPFEQAYAMLCEDCDGENTAWNREDNYDPRNSGLGVHDAYSGFDKNVYGP
jgi:hypothetical protein